MAKSDIFGKKPWEALQGDSVGSPPYRRREAMVVGGWLVVGWWVFWKQLFLGGGFKYFFMFTPIWGKVPNFD